MSPSRIAVRSLAFVLAFAAAAVPTGLADRSRAARETRELAASCRSLLEQGDEMAVIDRLRILEGSEDRRAVRVNWKNREIAGFGETVGFDGASFRTPFEWIDVSRPTPELSVEMRSRSLQGPLLMGFVAMACLGFGLFLAGPRVDDPTGSRSQGPGTEEPSKTVEEEENRLLDRLSAIVSEGLLILDARLRVVWADRRAAEMLGRDLAALKGRHLLELSPTDDLIRSIEENGVTRIGRPFHVNGAFHAVLERDFPGVVVRLRSDAS